MSQQVKFLAGSKTDLLAKFGEGSLTPGALYFCTDEKKIYKATAENAFEAVNEEVCYGALPEAVNAFPGKLYLRKSDMTLHVVNEAKDAFKQLSAPADALAPGDVSDDLNADDSKLLASKAAIKAGIKAVADDLADEVTRATTAEAQLLQDAKDYADGKDTALHTTISAEIDADVKVEKDRAELAEQGLAGRLDVIEGEEEGSIKKAVADEADRAKAAEKVLTDNLAAEVTRATNAETALGKRIDDLAGDGEGSVADQVGKVQDALDEFKNNVVGAPAKDEQPATGLFKEIADEKAAREAKDTELDNAIKDEAARAKGIEEANTKAIADEATRAKAAEKANADAIAVLNGDANTDGSVAKAVKVAVEAEKSERVAKDDELQGAINDINAALGLGDGVTGGLGVRLSTVEGKVDTLEEKASALETAVGAPAVEGDPGTPATGLHKDVDDLKAKDNELQAAIDTLNGSADEDGSVAKAVKDAVDAEAKLREDADTALDERLDAIETSIGTGGDLEKRVAANEAKLTGLEKETVQAAIDQAEADAKAHAEQKIAELVDSAPDAMNTLGELAGAIKAHEDVYKAYVETVTSDIATAKQEAIDAAVAKDAVLKTELQAEIDSDVAAEKALREAEETKIRGEFAAADTALHTTISAEIDADVKVEKDRAEAAESKLTQDLAQEIQNRTDAVKGVQDKLDALTGTGTGSIAEKVQVVQNALDTFKGEQATKDAAQDKALTDAIAKEVEDRDAAIKVEADRAKGVEAGFETRIATNEAFVAAQPAIDAEQDRRLKALEDTNAEGGAMKEAVDAAQDAADAAQADVDAVEKVINGDPEVEGDKGLVGRIEANEAFVAAQPDVDKAQDDRIEALEEFVEDHDHTVMEAGIAANKAFVDAQPAVDKAQNDRIEALEGLFEGENSIEAKIAAAQTAAVAEATRLDGILKTQLEGYADQAEADAEAAAETKAKELDAALKTSLEGYADQAEADAIATAKAHTNDALTWGSF